MQTLQRRPLIFTAEGVLDEAECNDWIGWAEERGFHQGALIGKQGVTWDDEVRNNDRVVADDFSKAGLLFSRLESSFPKLGGWAATGCNERMRIYRYDPGQRFRTHRDAYFERAGGERSKLTLLVYLNEGYTGGETWFENVTVKPRRGMALAFEHDQSHSGVTVTEGRKYVARTDVMYFPDFSG